MKVQPRHQLLQIWRGVLDESFDGKNWKWGGREGRNSISDAEQLLCVLSPATSVDSFALDEPDSTSEDVLAALKDPLGDAVDIPRRLLEGVAEYLATYTATDGSPIFSGEDFFTAPEPVGGAAAEPGELTPELRAQHVVDSFVVSINLSLAAIGFARQFRRSISHDRELLDRVTETEQLASKRLTAAMVALVRSFTVWVFAPESRDGLALSSMINQTGMPEDQVQREFRGALREVRAGLSDLTIGIDASVIADLSRGSKMFECGWSWGVVRGAPKIETVDDIGQQVAGYAEEGAYIYFTVVALDGIDSLYSERTQLLNLLTDEQQRLARALQVRSDLTRRYWSAVATFGKGRWPLEDLPWRRTNENESDYFSLLVTSIVVQDLVKRRADDNDLDRVGRVLENLANRARITLRSYIGDIGPRLHAPGVKISLSSDSEGTAPALSWVMSDFSPLLMKRVVSVAGLLRDSVLRGRMLDLSDRIWEHLFSRRMERGRGVVWDQPAGAFPELDVRHTQPSWYITKRVVDSLVSAAEVVRGQPLRSDRLMREAVDLLGEASHLYDQELLRGPVDPGPSMRATLQYLAARLERARGLATERPGTAVALVNEVLRELDQLAAARDYPAGQL